MNHIPMILLPVKTKGDIILARESIFDGLEKQFPRVSDEIKNHVKDGRDVLDCLITNLAISAIANDQLDKELKEVNDANQTEIEECNKAVTKGYGQAYEIIQTQEKKYTDHIESLEEQVQQLQQALAMFRSNQ